LGIELPPVPVALGFYRPAVTAGNFVYVSGQLPLREGRLLFKGKVGSEVSVEEAIEASKIAGINALSAIKEELGTLDRVKRIVKVTGYVASAPGFEMHAAVINGVSELFYQVFGESGIHARAAVGVYELPMGAPVEIEVIVEIFP
jgi:enamine deaminase RidA (YjgF/YER057c/UK114 family)